MKPVSRSSHRIECSERYGQLLAPLIGDLPWPKGANVAAVVDEQDRVSGMIGFCDYNTKAVQVHVWLGDRAAARELICYAFHYAYIEAGVNWTLGMCYGNEGAVEFDKKLGYKELTRVKDAHPNGDVVMVGLHKDDPAVKRWLERGKRYQWSQYR